MNLIDITENEQKIINFLADYPEEGFLMAEITKKTKISAGGSFNALKCLYFKKMILYEQKGKIKLWRINITNPIVKQLRILSMLNSITKLTGEIKNRAIEIILFGSGARGEYDKDSDIDFLVVTHDKEEINKIIKKHKSKYPIKAIIKTPNEWHEMEIKEPEFYNEVKVGIKL